MYLFVDGILNVIPVPSMNNYPKKSLNIADDASLNVVHIYLVLYIDIA